MFAVSFDMVIDDLKVFYGDPCNNAYAEIRSVMANNGFEWIQGSTYITETEDMGRLFLLIQQLSRIDWFRKSVRDIRGYRIENWSDFTDMVKNG